MAKLVKCKLCEKDISSSVKKCPHCGEKQEKYTILVVFAVIVGLIIIVGKCSNDNSVKPAPQNIIEESSSTIDNVVEDDPDSYIQVSTVQLFNDYHKNEVAADNLYRNKKILISGIISSINRGIGENYYLLLFVGHYTFENVQANFEVEYKDYLSQLNKGQQIYLICVGDGLLIGSPQLKNCHPLPNKKNYSALDNNTSNTQNIYENGSIDSKTIKCLEQTGNGDTIDKLNNATTTDKDKLRITGELISCQALTDVLDKKPKRKVNDLITALTLNKSLIPPETINTIYVVYSQAYDSFYNNSKNIN